MTRTQLLRRAESLEEMITDGEDAMEDAIRCFAPSMAIAELQEGVKEARRQLAAIIAQLSSGNYKGAQ